MSAPSESVSANAAVLDWHMNTLRESSNGWRCLPDNENAPGNVPWCVNRPWLNFLHAYVKKEEPIFNEFGIAYMLTGTAPVSNSAPFAPEIAGGENNWVTGLVAHLISLVPNRNSLKALSTDHLNGGHWLMRSDTPYAHIRLPAVNRMEIQGAHSPARNLQ